MLEWLYWGALGVSAAKAGIENSKCKQDVRTLPNGVRYYYDRRGITRLCSNDKPIYTKQSVNSKFKELHIFRRCNLWDRLIGWI
jgi:hypothetical protein